MMFLDFTVQAYTALAVYILLYLAGGVALYFTVRGIVHALKSISRGSVPEGRAYQGSSRLSYHGRDA